VLISFSKIKNTPKHLNMINHTNHISDKMEMEISKVGERGQIVIPQEFRDELHIKKGEKFLVVKSDNKLIFQQIRKLKAKNIDQLREDLIDMKIAEDRIKEIEQERVIPQTKKQFLKEMKKWVEE